MLNRRRMAAAIMLLCCGGIGFADINKVGSRNLGAGIGFVTGYGLSYRQWFNKNGFQLTTAPFYNKTDYDERITISCGATALRIIKEAKLVNLIGYLGPHFFYEKSRYKHNNYYGGNDDDVYYTKMLFLGGGPGIDFHFLRISFNIMCGFAYHHDFSGSESGINFTGETALYYSF